MFALEQTDLDNPPEFNPFAFIVVGDDGMANSNCIVLEKASNPYDGRLEDKFTHLDCHGKRCAVQHLVQSQHFPT